jgi:hypothetical protein
MNYANKIHTLEQVEEQLTLIGDWIESKIRTRDWSALSEIPGRINPAIALLNNTAYLVETLIESQQSDVNH